MFPGQNVTHDHEKFDCENKTISTIPSFNVTIFPKSIELFECLINSPIVNDLKKINISTDALEILDLTFMTTYPTLDDKCFQGLQINKLTVKSRTMLPAMRQSLYPLKNLTHLELTNVLLPDLPDGLINLTLRETNTLPVHLSSCENLKQLNIINSSLVYICEGFLEECVNLKTVFIQFGKNRFNLSNLFNGSNISLDYLEIHDDPMLLNTGMIPMRLSDLSFTRISGLQKLNLSFNQIWSYSR